jgi:hypothetical protein
MPATDEHAFDPLPEPVSAPRDTLDAVHYDWLGVRVGGPGATMRGSWPVLIAAMLVVFGCFFLIGLLSTGNGSSKQSSSAAPVARAAVPGKLGGETPIPAGVPNAIAQPPRRSVAPPRTTATVHQTTPFAGATTTTATSTGSPPEAPVAQEATPTQHSTQSTGQSQSHSNEGSSGGGSTGASAGPRPGRAAGGGGSFDSSE